MAQPRLALRAAMTNRTWNRVSAASGILTVTLLVVGFSSSRAKPSWSASGTSIAQSYADHRNGGLASVIIAGVRLMALLWIAEMLGSVLRADDDGRVWSVALAAPSVSLTHRVADEQAARRPPDVRDRTLHVTGAEAQRARRRRGGLTLRAACGVSGHAAPDRPARRAAGEGDDEAAVRVEPGCVARVGHRCRSVRSRNAGVSRSDTSGTTVTQVVVPPSARTDDDGRVCPLSSPI